MHVDEIFRLLVDIEYMTPIDMINMIECFDKHAWEMNADPNGYSNPTIGLENTKYLNHMYIHENQDYRH